MTHTIRRTAGALGIAAAALALLASPAGASGETIGGCAIDAAIEAEEHLAEDGIAFHNLHDEELETEFAELEKAMEGCLEAPSPIIPELDEIIWGGGAFLVLFVFMVWKGFPPFREPWMLEPTRLPLTSTPLTRPWPMQRRSSPTMRPN